MFDLFGVWHDPTPWMWNQHRAADPWDTAEEPVAEPIGPYADLGPRGYQRSDARIREEVAERLKRHGDLDASDIDIWVNDGEVTLDGTVEDREQKVIAELLTERVSGVKDVRNQLRVALPLQTSQF